MVLSGRVIIEMGDVWGNNSVLSSVGAGGIFAEAYACVPGEPLMVNVTAAEDTEVLLLHIGQVLEPCAKVCPRHLRLLRNLLTLSAGKNLQLSRRVLHTSPKSIRKRLLSYFSECIKRTGSYEFDIPYNRQQLADYLSVERSALSNELSLMQRDGLSGMRKTILMLWSKLMVNVKEVADEYQKTNGRSCPVPRRKDPERHEKGIFQPRAGVRRPGAR